MTHRRWDVQMCADANCARGGVYVRGDGSMLCSQHAPKLLAPRPIRRENAPTGNTGRE